VRGDAAQQKKRRRGRSNKLKGIFSYESKSVAIVVTSNDDERRTVMNGPCSPFIIKSLLSMNTFAH